MDRTKSIVTVYLDERQRANVHEATCHKLANLRARGDVQNHQFNPISGNARNETALWNIWHLGISGECAGHHFIGAVFRPTRYQTFDWDEPDVGGLFDMKSARPKTDKGQDSCLIVRDYEIERHPTLVQVLAYVSDVGGQPNARVQLMGWRYNEELPMCAERVHESYRPQTRGMSRAYFVPHTALHGMDSFPY